MHWAAFGGGKKLLQLSDSAHPVRAATISPDGTEAIATYASGGIKRFDLTTSRVLPLASKAPTGVGWYDPTGKRLVISDMVLPEICDVQTGRVIASIPGTYTGSFDISADGACAVFACRNRSAKVVDLSNGHVSKVLGSTENDVNTVNISPDGTLAITNERNGTSEIWNTKNGHRVAVLRGYRSVVQNACFSQDGRLVSTRGTKQDGSCRVYYTYADDVLSLAKKQLESMK
jgi:WD40 repeat protein